jgi:hypothetical protein
MTSSDLAGWSAFFSTAAESSATLAGLVMVAISVNVREIIAYDHLPARAGAAISSLCLALVMSLAVMAPQPPMALAVEIDLAAAWSWYMHISVGMKVIQGHRKIGRPTRNTIASLALGQVQVWPLTAAAVLLTLGHVAGIYCLAITVCAALVVSVINAWVLLVEILR